MYRRPVLISQSSSSHSPLPAAHQQICFFPISHCKDRAVQCRKQRLSLPFPSPCARSETKPRCRSPNPKHTHSPIQSNPIQSSPVQSIQQSELRSNTFVPERTARDNKTLLLFWAAEVAPAPKAVQARSRFVLKGQISPQSR